MARFVVKCKDEMYLTYCVYDTVLRKFLPHTEDTIIEFVEDDAADLEYEHQPAPPHGSIYGEPVE
jgi:hypothetical protein